MTRSMFASIAAAFVLGLATRATIVVTEQDGRPVLIGVAVVALLLSAAALVLALSARRSA